MNSKAYWLAVAAVGAAAPAKADYHTLSYYYAHPTEMRQQIAWCADNRGLAPKVPSCENAYSANRWQALCSVPTRIVPSQCTKMKQ